MEEEDLLVGLALLLLLKKKQENEKRRKLWSRRWLLRRREESVSFRLMKKLREEDPATLRQWIRLDWEQFEELLAQVTPLIEKQDTNMRQAVTPAERLTLTLRYLASGESYRSLSCQFRISHTLISSIVPSVCKAIYEVLGPRYISLPKTEEEWQKVASDFYTQWNFPMCIGALDGKRILIQKPINSGSGFYDYKGHFSVIMMALVDADCKFLYVDVGSCGRASDGSVWDRCTLRQAVESDILNIPKPQTIPFTGMECPYVFVGDDAFPLKKYLMKPYPGRGGTEESVIYNYRLSRARRTSENAFGIMTARFQVFKQPLRIAPKHVEDITLAAVALHNMLREKSKDTYSPPELLDREDVGNGRLQQGQMHQHANAAMEGLRAVGRGHTNDAKEVRDTLKDYFNNEGQVPWQAQMALLH